MPCIKSLITFDQLLRHFGFTFVHNTVIISVQFAVLKTVFGKYTVYSLLKFNIQVYNLQ